MLEALDAWAAAYRPYKDGRWCYEDGCVHRGLDLLWQATGERRWLDHLIRLASPQVGADGELAGYDPDEFNIDNILAGRALWTLAREAGGGRWGLAAQRLASQLDRHPRIAAGNWWHKRRYPQQVWLDGLYMALPFQVELGVATGRPERVADALRQAGSALRLTARPDGLHAHGYDESRAQAWADPVTGQSPAVWARATGWLAMALVDAWAGLPGGDVALARRTAAVLAALVERQRPSGLWLQVLDRPDLPGNYEETSASAMLAYALLRAARLNLAPAASERFRAPGLAAWDALCVRLGRDGARVRLPDICRVAGLGGLGGVYRDGSAAYYLSEERVDDDAKGFGPLMMAAAEAGLVER